MFGLGIPELIIIAIILLLVFGGKRLPEIGKNLGRTVSEFRKVKKEMTAEKTKGRQQEEKKALENVNSLENKLINGATDKISVVKKAGTLKEKADKIKDIIG
jgi:sec-independent protein translocase protein TatA